MPQVDFYILPSSEPRDRLEYACKLTAKAWREGMQVYLRCIDAAQCAELDQRLWRFRGESFVPHDLIEEAPDSPVVLGTGEPPQNREGLLINLAAGVPARVEGFARVAELFRGHFDSLELPLPQQPTATWPCFDEQLEAVLQARPAVFSFVYGVPSEQAVERCRSAGILTLGTATSVAEARALEAAGVEAVVASGFEAGGHRAAFLADPEEGLIGTLALVPQVVDALHIPVVAAGGIADGRGVAAALCLGAQAVQIGTAFLACRESGTSDLHRQALLDPNSPGTALTRAFSGRLARGIRNRLLEDLAASQHLLAGYPAQGEFASLLKPPALAQGRGDLLALWSGQSAPLLRDTELAALWRRLLTGTDALLGAGPSTP